MLFTTLQEFRLIVVYNNPLRERFAIMGNMHVYSEEMLKLGQQHSRKGRWQLVTVDEPQGWWFVVQF